MSKVVTFGELMIRLQPYNYERFVQADHLEFSFGGGEANVAVSLANYGLDAAYVTKLPAHAIGQAAVNSLRRYGVDTSKIVRGGDRVGIYFNEKGASQRGSVCIYDRAHSAIQEATTADFDWDKIFEGVDWFHFTGITPALGPNVVEICKEACKAAKAHGVKISCDLNYRGKLWTREQAREDPFRNPVLAVTLAITRRFDRAGNRIPGVPANQLLARIGYDVPTGPLAGLGAFVETVFQDDFTIDNANLLKAPGYAIVNANIHYDTALTGGYAKRLNLYVEVRNLFDTVYIASAQNLANTISGTTGFQNGAAVLATTTGSIYAGAPRTFTGGMRLAF